MKWKAFPFIPKQLLKFAWDPIVVSDSDDGEVQESTERDIDLLKMNVERTVL